MSESHKNSDIFPVGTNVALKYDRFNPNIGEVIGHTDNKMIVVWPGRITPQYYMPVELRRV
jgi:hypothetical protein